jgi:hypothetical protein
MGMFLNRGNEEFTSVVNSEIYVDKTDIINFFNQVLNTEQSYVCISRPRRFGKSITANMIAAYFEKGCDSRSLFEGRIRTFENDMVSFKRKDDVLTALIHLGYLAYDTETEEAYIPNKEVRMCFEDTLEDTGWDEVIKAVDK